MSIIQKILSQFIKKPNTGLLLESPAQLEKLPHHEIFAGGGEVINWHNQMPPFRYQGPSYWCTAYAGTSIGSAFEKKENGNVVLFSPIELFYRSNGSVTGNYLVNVANAMKDGFVLEKDMPTVIPDSWGVDVWKKYRDGSRATDEMRSNGKPYRTKDFAVVNTDWKSLRRALSQSPLMVAIGIGKSYWADIVPKQSQYVAYHAVVITDMVEDTNGNPLYIEIFDSLTQRSDFNGFHKLAADYEIMTALSFIDLPNDWKEKQKEAINAVSADALNHYGNKRNILAEQMAAAQFSGVIKHHPSLSALAGKQWTVLVNALVYGRYSMTDLLNHLTNIRRTGKPIFNLNKMRNQQ